MTPDLFLWGTMSLGCSDSSWLLAWVMIEICCEDANEIKHGKYLVFSEHLGAVVYNYYYYSLQ